MNYLLGIFTVLREGKIDAAAQLVEGNSRIDAALTKSVDMSKRVVHRRREWAGERRIFIHAPMLRFAATERIHTTSFTM